MGNTAHAVIHKCYRESYPLSALYASTISLHRLWGTFRRIDHFITPSAFVKQKIAESGLVDPGKISVVGNFLSGIDRFPEVATQREPSVVYLGRLSQEKGIEELVEAFRALPDIQLKILGTGPLENKIKETIAKERLTNIHLMGFMDGAEKWRLIRSSLAVAIPSGAYEVFPVTAVESMAAGTPVIVTSHGSLPTIIEDGRTGLAYQSGDVRELCDKIRWLQSNSDRVVQMGVQAQEVVRKRYTADTHYQQLMAIYKKVIR
jgi:glycosyltransferase involved in cell wall biosynthesis